MIPFSRACQRGITNYYKQTASIARNGSRRWSTQPTQENVSMNIAKKAFAFTGFVTSWALLEGSINLYSSSSKEKKDLSINDSSHFVEGAAEGAVNAIPLALLVASGVLNKSSFSSQLIFWIGAGVMSGAIRRTINNVKIQNLTNKE